MTQYPYMWGYPPPPMPMLPPPDNNQLERGMRIAMKIAQREEREKERKREKEKRERDAARKEARESTRRMFTSIEIFILGILAYPFAGPLYNHLIKLAGG